MLQQKFANIKDSTSKYGKTVWSKEKLMTTTCLGYKCTSKYIQNFLTLFEKKCYFFVVGQCILSKYTKYWHYCFYMETLIIR